MWPSLDQFERLVHEVGPDDRLLVPHSFRTRPAAAVSGPQSGISAASQDWPEDVFHGRQLGRHVARIRVVDVDHLSPAFGGAFLGALDAKVEGEGAPARSW